MSHADMLQRISSNDDHGGVSLTNEVFTDRYKKSNSRQYMASRTKLSFSQVTQ